MDFHKLIKEFENCPCGQKHECAIGDIRIGSGITADTGEILKENNFPKRILLVADKTTLKAADGIEESLRGFETELLIYDTLRVATMADVKRIEGYLDRGIGGVLAVGTGSVHDICRLACANRGKPLCLFATAASMDGFASYSAPIVDNNFKITYPAKCPEVIIADTKILAAAPKALKSAGFGDMAAKYVALIDWRVSNLLSGESYCERVAALTEYAADAVMRMADQITADDEAAAAKVFEGLLLTGIAMSFTKTSRPGSGCEHIMAHYMECKELLENKIPNFHGEDVGVTTLVMLKIYGELLKFPSVKCHAEKNDWEKIERMYGPLAQEMKKLNFPETITSDIPAGRIEDNFAKIQEIVRSVPSYETVKDLMRRAGCKLTRKDIGKSEAFMKESLIYHVYMRRRLSLRRLMNMMEPDGLIEEFTFD